jgi:hypothetical protein
LKDESGKIDKINGSLRESVVKNNISLKLKDLSVNNFYQCYIVGEDIKKYYVNVIGSTFTGLLKKTEAKKSNYDYSMKPIVILRLAEFDKNVKPLVINFSNKDFDESEIDKELIINNITEEEKAKNTVYSELFENITQIILNDQEQDNNNELKDIQDEMNDIAIEDLVEDNENSQIEEDEENEVDVKSDDEEVDDENLIVKF